MRDLWSRREFIFAVPRNSLRAQNMDTLLGNFWYLLNPALQTSVYFLVFGLLFDANRGIDDYLAYLVIGVLTFVSSAKQPPRRRGALRITGLSSDRCTSAR